MKKLNEYGQSSIEFILSMAFIMGLFFLFINQAFNFSIGYLAHYATFMASRAFMVQDKARMDSIADYNGIIEDAKSVGTKVFKRHQLEIFLGSSVGEVGFNSPDTGSFYEYTGAYFQFQRPFSTYESFGGGVMLDLLSESFLGKEPTRVECKNQVCNAIAGSDCGGASDILKYSTVYDNGC